MRLFCCLDTQGQAAVRPALLVNHHEPAQSRQRTLGARSRRLHAGAHLRAH